VFTQLPAQEGGRAVLAGAFDPATLLPAERAYYAFAGSLTTPPCSEEVRWQVLKTPVEVSAGQLAAFRKLYAMNARPVQPLNDRKVTLVR
jgi:carbonic anhydrase